MSSTFRVPFHDIPTSEIEAAFWPHRTPTPAETRKIRRWKAGDVRLTAGDVYVIWRVMPTIDVLATLERAYELEELRKMQNNPPRPDRTLFDATIPTEGEDES